MDEGEGGAGADAMGAGDGGDGGAESLIESRLDALGDAIGALRRSLPNADMTGRLTAQVDALPDTLAARLGIEASVAALGVRMGGIASAIDQTRLTTQAVGEQIRNQVDEPEWLGRLVARFDAVDRAVQSTHEAGAAQQQAVLDQLRTLGERIETIEAAAAAAMQAAYADQAAALEALDQRTRAIATQLDKLDKIDRLDNRELTAEVHALGEGLATLAQAQRPADTVAEAMKSAFDRMEQRDRSLAARLDRLEAIVTAAAERPAPTVTPDESVAPALDGLAAATDDLAALVGLTSARLEERLAAVEAAATAAASGRAENAATMAMLRAERALVQSKLNDARRR